MAGEKAQHRCPGWLSWCLGSSPKWLPARLLVSVHAVPKIAQNGTEGAVTVLRLRAIDPHRLAGAVIDELDPGLLEERGFAVQTDLELGHARRADDLFRRDPIRAFGKDSDELDTAARNDDGLEAVCTEVAEQLQLRLVNKVGVEPIEPGGARRREPFM